MAIKVLTHEQACVLYDVGVREIAASGCDYTDKDSHWLVERRANNGEWEPEWAAPGRNRESLTVRKWTYAVVVE